MAFKALEIKIFNFEQEEKLFQNFDVKFDEESEFDSFESGKSSRDPLSGPKIEIFNFELGENLD